MLPSGRGAPSRSPVWEGCPEVLSTQEVPAVGQNHSQGWGWGRGELPRHSRSAWPVTAGVTVILLPLLWVQVVPLVPLEGLGSQLGLGVMLPRKSRGNQEAEKWGDPLARAPRPSSPCR